jgi:hypothetical protein
LTAAVPTKPVRRSLLLGLGLLSYLLFIVAQMPLAWLITRMPADSPIQVQKADGTFWNGTLQRVSWQKESDRIELGKLSWRWLPVEVFNGRLGFEFKLAESSRQLGGILLLGRNGHSLKNVQGQLDAALLGFASRPLSLLQPKGSLLLDIGNLYFSEKRIHGAASLDWLDARSGLVAAPLGEYRAKLDSDPDGRRARIEVITRQGPLALQGNAEYQPGKAMQGSLRLTPPVEEAGNVYRPLLDFLGRPNASGTWVLYFNSR